MEFCQNPDIGCATDGKSSKLEVLMGSLTYNFSKNLATGTITGPTTKVNVKTVTVESSDI